ncbi:MAG TPA: hypothetical protein VJO72_11580, partial [Candidatus Dormibacteraeota bacterium]|nr:hypothetical protein [Candidatus Dormibacteraeota bacterium]
QLSIGGAMFWVQNDVAASRDGRVTGSVRIILSVDDPDSAFERVSQPGPPSKPRSTKSTGGEPGGAPIRSATTGS